jgi:hypothetical protein
VRRALRRHFGELGGVRAHERRHLRFELLDVPLHARDPALEIPRLLARAHEPVQRFESLLDLLGRRARIEAERDDELPELRLECHELTFAGLELATSCHPAYLLLGDSLFERVALGGDAALAIEFLLGQCHRHGERRLRRKLAERARE